MKTVDAYKQGDGYATLCKRLNIPRSKLRIIIKKQNETHCIENDLSTGRKRLMSEGKG